MVFGGGVCVVAHWSERKPTLLGQNDETAFTSCNKLFHFCVVALTLYNAPVICGVWWSECLLVCRADTSQASPHRP